MQKAYINPSKLKECTIHIPGSKSYTNRALIIASLADGKTVLQNPLFSDDTIYTIEALKKLGVRIERTKNDDLEVHGKGGVLNDPEETLFLGNAGTGIRFITALLSLAPFKSKITGNIRMQKRPIKDLITALRQLGVKIESVEKNGCPPIKIRGSVLKGGEIELSGSVSSQYLSALLMIAPYAQNDVTIKITDELVSKPYIDMTLQIMNDFGVKVENKNYQEFIVKAGERYNSCDYKIEGDASSATYFFALSALHNVPIHVQNVYSDTSQADIHFLDVLEKMGCSIHQNEKEIYVQTPDKLKSLGEIDLNHMPDAAMTVAIVATFAEGKSVLKNIANLRVKECDRINALVTELKKVGVDCKELSDGIEINGDSSSLHGDALISTYRDHRMAMCFALLASKIPDIQIINPECTSKTYPNFFKDLEKTGLEIKIKTLPNITLTGMRGSGKSSVGRNIARKLHRKFIDTDDEIEKQEKMKISKIVKKHNWFYFRKKEKYVVRRISKMDNVVISTGGGVILDKENVSALKKKNEIVFLKCDLDVLQKRLEKSKTKRPSLTSQSDLKEEINEIWNKRKESYEKSADIIFDVSKDIGVELKAEKIIMEL
jgi:3-phosphoshikimate 1-carboxyvinyltransferase